jgi:hypothetical protein
MSRLHLNLNLDSGAHLTVRSDDLTTVGWRFRYRARHVDPDDRVGMVLDTTLSVAYYRGVLRWDETGLSWPDDKHRVALTVHLVLPKKRGVKFAWGVDLSPGSEGWFEFYYVPKTELVALEIAPDLPVKALRLCEVYGGPMGKFQRIEIPEVSEAGSTALVRSFDPVDIPFPLREIVTPYTPRGPYQIPFLGEDGKVHHFEFPESISSDKP